jgi:hypothetical protein
MKNYIQNRYSQYEKDQISYSQLKRAVIKIWKSIIEEQLSELINLMHNRYWDVI